MTSVAPTAAVRHRAALITGVVAMLELEMVPTLGRPEFGLDEIFAGCNPTVAGPLLARLRAVRRYECDFTELDGSRPYLQDGAETEIRRIFRELLAEYDRTMAEIYGGK